MKDIVFPVFMRTGRSAAGRMLFRRHYMRSLPIVFMVFFMTAPSSAQQAETYTGGPRIGGPLTGRESNQVILPPALKNTYYVLPDAEAGGDGSPSRPWKELQAALEMLHPGDRLVMLSGRYDKSVVIGDTCRDGTVEEPIELLANVDAVLSVEGDGPVVEVRKAHWRFYGLEITPGESKGPAFMSYGKGAHDILLDRAHFYRGMGDGLVIGPHSRKITILNSHIHHFGNLKISPGSYGLMIMPGSKEITITGSNIHNNSAGAYVIVSLSEHPIDRDGQELSEAEGIDIQETRMRNNR